MIGEKTIGRLSLYRRLLDDLLGAGVTSVYSHQLAEMAGATAAQVRRDLMALHVSGSPRRGYDARALSVAIGETLDAPAGQQAALVGVGNLGRALLAYFRGRRPKLSIGAAFDSDPSKAGRVIHGCRCHPLETLPDVVRDQDIHLGIVAVPASDAQDVASRLVGAGITALLNFAPVRLRLDDVVHVEDIDITTALEKVAYFARQGRGDTPPRDATGRPAPETARAHTKEDE